MTSPALLFGLAAGTLLSEDLASISAGLLARDGIIGLAPAIAVCAAGVYLGDLGLWALGGFCGRRLLRTAWMAKRFDVAALDRLGARLDANLPLAVLASRFLPGTRLPMYLAVGLFGRRPWAFAAWSFGAVLLWTPMVVWLAHTFGASVTAPLLGELNHGAPRLVLSTAVLFAVWRLTARFPRSVVNQMACDSHSR